MFAFDRSRSTDASGVKIEEKADHAVLHPPQALKARAYVPMRSNDPTPDQHIGMADEALADVSVNFQNWMSSETDKLADARAHYRHRGALSDARDQLFQASHAVRGNAGVFGYPLAGRVADSLCKLLDRCPPPRIPAALVDQHVDAVAAMVREDAKGMAHKLGRDLAMKLIEVTEEFLNKVAPET